MNNCTRIYTKISVVDPHHLYSAQAPRKNFAAAPALRCNKPAFLKTAHWYIPVIGKEQETHQNFDAAPQNCLKLIFSFLIHILNNFKYFKIESNFMKSWLGR
jgi:hypothetical protein